MKPAYFKATPTAKSVIIGYLLIILFALLPILLAMLAGGIGYCMGCNINEAGTDECIKMGIHFGPFLSGIGVLGWFAILTLPAGFIAFIIWTIIGIHAAIYYTDSNRNESNL